MTYQDWFVSGSHRLNIVAGVYANDTLPRCLSFRGHDGNLNDINLSPSNNKDKGTFDWRMWLSSVDLPAFGAPRTAITWHRWSPTGTSTLFAASESLRDWCTGTWCSGAPRSCCFRLADWTRALISLGANSAKQRRSAVSFCGRNHLIPTRLSIITFRSPRKVAKLYSARDNNLSSHPCGG